MLPDFVVHWAMDGFGTRGSAGTDTRFVPTIRETDLERACLAERMAITLTCVPPGSGVGFGIDRDLDGVRDGNE